LSIHRALRLTLKDRGRAQRAVDTSRWLYNKIETKPERERLREFGGLPHCPGIVLASYVASLNTYSALQELWCAVLGLNQLNRIALVCSRRTPRGRRRPTSMRVADQPGQRGELVGGDAVFEIPRA
jgi:hypothetical protein